LLVFPQEQTPEYFLKESWIILYSSITIRCISNFQQLWLQFLINHEVNSIDCPTPLVIQLRVCDIAGGEQLFDESLYFVVDGVPGNVYFVQLFDEFVTEDLLKLVPTVVHHCEVRRVVVTLSFVQGVVFVPTPDPEFIV
jgi:hypothetical protein